MIFAAVLISLVLLYLVGPRAGIPILDPTLPDLDIQITGVEEFIRKQEAAFSRIKPENASRLVWADDSNQVRTPISIVYLHGFSAGPMEGEPLHREIAKRYGANLYIPRLYGHGLQEGETFIDITPQKLLESAKEAIVIGKLLGEKVVIMGCSTGGTLGLFLAGGDPDIAGLILYSPNIDVYDKTSAMLLQPWGLQIARIAFGGKYREFEATEEVKKYWSNRYRLEGLICLKQLLAATMTKTVFKKIDHPLFVGCYYKNEEEQDKVISIPRIHEMFELVSTSADKKRKILFEHVGSHVLGSQYYSQDLEVSEQRRLLSLRRYWDCGHPNNISFIANIYERTFGIYGRCTRAERGRSMQRPCYSYYKCLSSFYGIPPSPHP